RTRPSLCEVTRPAFSSTPRCWVTVGSAIANGLASSLTEAGPRDSRSTMARRLLSPSAWNTSSRLDDLVADIHGAAVEGFRLQQLKVELCCVVEQWRATPERHRMHNDAELVDQPQVDERVDQLRAGIDRHRAAGFRLEVL